MVRGVTCVYSMRRAPSTTGIIGGGGGACLVCLFVFFHVGKQEEEHMRHHARVARLHKLQRPHTERCEATVHRHSPRYWREMGRLGW